MKTFWKACLVRSVRTICQTLASMLPVGMIITPAILQSLDWTVVYIILAWFGTGILSGVASALTSIATGLPEAEHENDLYMHYDEPADSEVKDDEK